MPKTPEDEPFKDATVQHLSRQISDEGFVEMSSHVETRIDERKLAEIDVYNVIRGGRTGDYTFEKGSYRYRRETPKLTVVIAFPPCDCKEKDKIVGCLTGHHLVVVTAWRNRK